MPSAFDQTTSPEKAPAQAPAEHHESLLQSLVNVPKDLVESAAYTAIQAPLSGVAQIVDQVAGTDVLPKVQFISAPDTANGNFIEKGSAMIGSAVGMALPFLLIHKGVTGLSSSVGLAGEGAGSVIGRSAISGALFSGVFTPSSTSGNFLENRLAGATEGALTFGTMSAAGVGLGKFGVTNRIAMGAFSGIPAGLVSAESNSLLSGKGFASRSDLLDSALQFGFVGGTLGAFHEMGAAKIFQPGDRASSTAAGEQAGTGAREFKVVTGQDTLDALRRGKSDGGALVGVREYLANGKTGPLRSLFVQHLTSPGSVNAETAAKADLIATCNPERLDTSLRFKHLFPNGAGTLWLSDGAKPGSAKFSFEQPQGQFGDAAMALGSDRVSRWPTAGQLLAEHGHADLADALKEIPKFRNMKATGFTEGNDSKVLFIAPSPELPDGAALKLTTPEGGWNYDWGKRPFDAQLLSDVHELDGPMGGDLYVYLQELVDTKDTYEHDDMNAFYAKLGNLEFADPGSDKQVGFSRKTGDLVLIDYPAVGAKGENETFKAIIGGTEAADRAYEEEDANPETDESRLTEDHGYGSVDFSIEARQQAALENPKLSPTDRDILKQLFEGFSVKDVALVRALEQGKFDARGNVDMKEAEAEVKKLKQQAVKQGLLQK